MKSGCEGKKEPLRTTALGVCLKPSGSTIGSKTWLSFVLPRSSPCLEGLIRQSAEIGVRVSLALDQAPRTGYSGCLKIGS